MKTLAILLLTFVFSMALVQTNAQETEKVAKEKAAIKKEKTVIKDTKSELKSEKVSKEKSAMSATKGELKTEKKELKGERKALRKLEGSTVNVISKNSFYADFGNLPNVKWKRTAYFDEAIFTKDGKEMKAYYDFFGKLVGTSSYVTFADVPVLGQKEINKRYKDYTIGQVLFFDDNEFNESDMLLYNSQFDDEDNYFVELAKGNNKIVLKVNTSGVVNFFKQL
jgi:hypothetical protein